MVYDESLEAYRARLDGAAIVTFVLAMLAVPAKIWCRIKKGGQANLGWDDVLSVVTLLLVNAFFWINMIGLRPYLGHHAGVDVPVADITSFLKFLFAASLTYVAAIAFIKFTILAFYWKLFSVAMRIPLLVTTLVVLGWMIAFLFLGTFGCFPVQANWDITITDAKCVEPKAVYLGGSIPNAAADLILMALPLPHIWRLHAPIGQRIVLAGMFALGFFICIVSIVRLTIVMSIPVGDLDVTFKLKDFMLWSLVEVNIGLVCACLPSMRLLLRSMGLGWLISSVRYASGSRKTPAPSDIHLSGSGMDKRPRNSKRGIFTSLGGSTELNSDEEVFQMVDRPPNRAGKNNIEVEAGRHSHGSDDGSHEGASQATNDGIVVQRDWSVLVHETNSR